VKAWDTAPVVKEPFEFYLEGLSCDEWAEGPAWAKLTVTQAFVDNLFAQQRLCILKNLERVVDGSFPDEWDNPNYLNVRDDELNVGQNNFWFRGRPKHASYDVETRLVGINDFFAAIARDSAYAEVQLAWAGGRLFSDATSAKALAERLVDRNVLSIDEETLEAMPEERRPY
jgi:hypothetical protein